jgi:lipopolysaccharide transport system ATP-binding protein
MGANAMAIRAEGVWKTYRIHQLGSACRLWRRPKVDFHALQAIDFELPEGAVLGIIGHNGAGKSTLLKILSRITDPTRGRLTIRGRVASLLEVGTGFHPELTGLENVFLNAAIHGLSRRTVRARLASIVDFAEIGPYLDEPVKRYSSGMYLRLAFGIAAHLDPDILILDEVLAVGDAAFRERCFGKMHEVSRSGRTVVLVSHDVMAIRALCSHALLLDRGQALALGPAEAVVARYLDGVVADSGVVHADARRLRLVDAAAVAESAVDGRVHLRIEFVLEAIEALRDLYVDFGLDGPTGARLLQVMPKVRGEPSIRVPAGARLRSRIDVVLPALRPGEYSGTLYAHSNAGEEILHIAGLPLLSIPPGADAAESLVPSFTAVLLPRYTVRSEVEGGRP